MFRSFTSIMSFAILSALVSSVALAADYPKPIEKAWVAKDFKFHTGEVLPELRITYTTIGNPGGSPVLLLHGTMGSASNFLNDQYAGELFGAGQPLDASKYFIIIPDAVGTGKSTKPSDGLKARFPKYNYEDMVHAQHQLLTEGLGLTHVRLVMGSSMGGMQTWMWGELYPKFMDLLAPMSSTPVPMGGRNWLTRRLVIETIRRDPDYKDGNYTSQPASLKIADAWFGITTSGGTLAYLNQAPNALAGDKLMQARLDAPVRGDANDMIYQYEASNDYDTSPALEKIEARVLAINSVDDERNPIELGLLEKAIKRVKNGRMFMIPTDADTRGHGTVGFAKFWKVELESFLSGNK